MPSAKDRDSSHGAKLLKLFLKLMLEGRKHYQADLAKQFNCSPQTIIRLIAEIEGVVGESLVVGNDNRRRYYQMKTFSHRKTLGLNFEELRYLSICHDLAGPCLPDQIDKRVETTIFTLSTLMADPDYARREAAQKKHIGFKSKGYIDYSPYFPFIEKLICAADEKKVCVVDYKPNSKKDTHIHLYAPGRVLSMNGALYIHGNKVTKGSFEKDKPMTLAIHRITEVAMTDKEFSFTPDTDEHGAFGMKWHEPVRYKIRFEESVADYVRERVWSEDQVINELDDGGLELELSAVSERELMAWIWSFGDKAKIL